MGKAGAGKQSPGVPRKPGRKKRTSVLCQVGGNRLPAGEG